MVRDISIRRINFVFTDRWETSIDDDPAALNFVLSPFTSYIFVCFFHFNSCVRPERARSSKHLLFFSLFHCGDGPHLSQCWRISLIIGREGDGVVGPHWLALCPFSFNQRKFSLFLFLILELGAWRLVVFRIQPSSSIQFFFRFSSNCSQSLFICATFSTFLKLPIDWNCDRLLSFIRRTKIDTMYSRPEITQRRT